MSQIDDIIIFIFEFVLGTDREWFSLLPLQKVSRQWERIVDYMFHKDFGSNVKMPQNLLKIQIHDIINHFCYVGDFIDHDININQFPFILQHYLPSSVDQNSINSLKIFTYSKTSKTLLWAPGYYKNTTMKEIQNIQKSKVYISFKMTKKQPSLPFFQPKNIIEYRELHHSGYSFLKNY